MRARALVIGLDAIELVSSRGAAGFGYLQRKLDTSASTLSAVLRELTERGFLQKTDREYRLGPAYPSLNARFMKDLDLHRIATPRLRELNETTDETVELGIPYKEGILIVEKIEPDDPVEIGAHVGIHLQLFHRTAMGKVFMAYQSEAERRNYYRRSGLTPNTMRTITSPELMEREIAEIRRERIAYDVGENLDHVYRIAAPVLNHADELVGIIAVAGRISRSDEAKRRAFGKYVQRAGSELTVAMGGVRRNDGAENE